MACLTVVLLAGCTGDGEETTAGPTTVPPPSPTATAPATSPSPSDPPAPSPEVSDGPTDQPTAEPTEDETEYPDAPGLIIPEGSVATCELAGPEFCEDANGNFFPDFVEEELGLDPTVLPCRDVDCPGVDSLEAGLGGLDQNGLIILDASGSMAGQVGGESKMSAAKSALVEYVSVTPESVDLGLMVYGHLGDNTDAGRAESCAGVETFAEVGELRFDTVEQVVGQFEPTGWTPIAASLEAAGPLLEAASAEDIDNGIEAPENRVVLISDGLETCEGDPVAAAQALVAGGIDLVVDVIGFDIAESDRAALEQVATVTGGTYTDVGNGDALRDALDVYSEQFFAAQQAISCLIVATQETTSCGLPIRQEAWAVIIELGDEAEAAGDFERGAFLRAWATTAEQENVEAEQAFNEDVLARLDEYDALIEEALARREELRAGGSKIAAAPDPTCALLAGDPAAGHRTGA